MPRIIVTTDLSLLPDDTVVLFDEEVHSVHLSTRHAAAQLVERIAWAITDAEAAEEARPLRQASPVLRSPRRSMHTRAPARLAVGA